MPKVSGVRVKAAKAKAKKCVCDTDRDGIESRLERCVAVEVMWRILKRDR